MRLENATERRQAFGRNSSYGEYCNNRLVQSTRAKYTKIGTTAVNKVILNFEPSVAEIACDHSPQHSTSPISPGPIR